MSMSGTELTCDNSTDCRFICCDVGTALCGTSECTTALGVPTVAAPTV